MKKLLLFIFLFSGIFLHAQQPYRQLIVSEACNRDWDDSYIEISNIGNQAINLSEFKLGVLSGSHARIYDLNNDPWIPTSPSWYFMLPDRELAAGESFVIGQAYDFGRRQYAKRPPGTGAVEFPNKIGYETNADLLIHFPEDNGDETDSVSFHWNMLHLWGGTSVVYLEHHFAEGDSAVIDQAYGVFDNDGRNSSGDVQQGFNVAGVVGATYRGPIVRKAKVTQGNLDFANARGLGEDDSEWIPIPEEGRGYNGYWNARDVWWTIGNHGSYVLDENTLESDVITVDFANKKLTVPWGIRRLDDVMRHMVKKPGIAWHYDLNESYEDSLYRSARTGDKLTITVTGNERQVATFDIVVSAPTNDANIVVPIDHKNLGPGRVTGNTQAGILSWPRVTTHEHGVDTISGARHGLPYNLRSDSLLKYLEKPSNASWEFVWVDGIERPDLKDGDKLKVTAQNGDVKEYHIEIRPDEPSQNNFLTAITWPDVPEYLKGIFGWKGDTIPEFSGGVTNYTLQIPLEVESIPALVAKTASLNAKVEVKRAKSFTGTLEDRTISFIVTAEDDSSKLTYNVELVKEKDPSKVQPYFADPFLGEFIYHENWSYNYVDVVNPGNQTLDLSNYMFTFGYGSDNPSQITSVMTPEDWPNRFRKYVPGYKWTSNEAEWQVSPGILEPDLNVSPFLAPGDVFTMGTRPAAIVTQSWVPGYRWPVLDAVDVQFRQRTDELNNPWNEPVTGGTVTHMPPTSTWNIYKILNDSVKNGLKPANDPRDFERIEAFGMIDNTHWVINGRRAADINTYIRKPHIYEPNPVVQASFGTNDEDSEWIFQDQAYWQNILSTTGGPWPGSQARVNIVNDIGKHFMIEPSHYKSTISSLVYKVSEGYSMEEEIRGVTTGTTVATFLNNIIKADENQELTLKSTANGSTLAGDAALSNNDTLVVLSADSTNTSKYILEVTDEGLDSDAVLTSTLYDVTVEIQPNGDQQGTGSVSGFEYGTRLRTLLNNINVPLGAKMDVINSEGKYVPLKMLNFDTAYVDVTVNSGIYLDVLAEDGTTRIVYQLLPSATENDAFVLSDIYTVNQSINLIQLIPRGTNLQTFLSNIVPSTGATVKLVNKMGQDKIDGGISQDDKVVVTSPNGLVTNVYHLSMLRTQYILTSDYLAYILSNVYAVDQVNYKVTGPTGATLVTEFNSNITPAMGATAVVTDADGNEKTSGNINNGDLVKVTSADGKMVVMYAIDIQTSVKDRFAENKVVVYPNPTSGRVNIQGVEAGTRIQVFNQTGALLRDIKSSSSLETLSLDNQPSGMYLVVLTKNSRLIGQYKVMRR